jgi:hypothetical protein
MVAGKHGRRTLKIRLIATLAPVGGSEQVNRLSQLW